MSITRRGILALLGGTAAQAASGISPKQAAAQLGVDLYGPRASLQEGVEAQIDSSPWRLVREAMWAKRDANERPDSSMPVHIRTKRSWSPAFKAHAYERERLVLDAFERKLQDDEAFAAKVARVMFGAEGGL